MENLFLFGDQQGTAEKREMRAAGFVPLIAVLLQLLSGHIPRAGEEELCHR